MKVPKTVFKHIPKTVKKKVCVSTKAHGYHDDHHGGGGYHEDAHDDHSGGYHEDVSSEYHEDIDGYSSNLFRSAPSAAINLDPYTFTKQPYTFTKRKKKSSLSEPQSYGKKVETSKDTESGDRRQRFPDAGTAVGQSFPSFGSFQIGSQFS